ncbi:MAG: transcriptional regulator [Lachnospiraceae bacterium]|nr:transcriptional regulator [Lachnospiraceae bacterium]
MNELFLKIVNMSISASWLVLAVLLLRFVFKKAPRWVNVLLWGIVAVRLIFPFSIESALSLIPSAETISPNIMMDKTPSVQTGIPVLNSVINPMIGSSLAPAPGDSANPLQIWIPILCMIWGIGVTVLLLYTVVSYWRLRRNVSEAVILRDNIFQSENVGSPFVLGVIRPKLYLPYKLERQDLDHVAAHEQAHIRRRDHWWKPLGFLLLTIHWFNPLMWLAYVLLCRDIELACDEKVIKVLDSGQRADYTRALVACSVSRPLISACPLAFGEIGVKKRVKSVMNYKKPSFWIIVLAVIACVAVAVCFLTNPVRFQFDETSHTIVSGSCFDFRAADAPAAAEMDPAQLKELSLRLAGVKNAVESSKYAGLTPGYQISALLQDGTYIRISGYSLSDKDMVDIEWNGERYVVNDRGFQDYLSRICVDRDIPAADGTVAGKTYLYEKEGIMGNFALTLYEDETFFYSEGIASSYMGIGTWTQDGDTITLTDKKTAGDVRINHFRIDGEDLVFLSEGSSNFIYVKVENGERFTYTAEVPWPYVNADVPEELSYFHGNPHSCCKPPKKVV